uniref:UBX domain-containing protein 1 n=1 Tax=Crotalus adamanteus TaxID=8729 RepID=A0A0F7Z398_CROAD
MESTALESLIEMGFPQNRAEKALALTGNQGIEQAMDWLVEHENDPSLDDPYVAPQGHVLDAEETPEGTTPDSVEGGSGELAEGETQQPLTEEEKQEQTKRMMELISQKQKEREEREKRESIEREKQRRKQGQELLLLRQKLQEDEMRKLAEERRREKLEEKLAKQRVREKIERDKAERAKKFGCSSATQASALPEQVDPVLISSPSQEPPVKREYDQCKIQVRLLDGTSLTHTFKAREQLAAVRLYVELNRQDGGEDPFHLLTSFPRRVFTEDDMEKPLQELGLVPSAVLIVAKKGNS